MSAQADITINDGAATPVAKTFKARGYLSSDPTTMRWLDDSSGLAVGNPQITIQHKDIPNSPLIKQRFKVALPVMKTISGSDGGYTPQVDVAFTGFADLVVTIPRHMSLADRKNLRAFAANLLANAIFAQYVQDYNPAV